MPIVGGLDIHRKQITFDYLGTVTGEVKRGPIAPADRAHVRAWLARFAGCGDVAFAVEGCAGWRYVAEELAAAGIAAHLGEPAGTAALRGRKRHAKTDKTDARHLRTLLAEGRLPECWIPPAQILEYRALERRRRAEAALVTVVATSYLLGVSTRRMEKLVETLGITRLSKSQVSEMAKDLDEQVEAFRTRPLDGGPYTFVAADALVLKVREAGRIVNVHALLATGVNADGYREILGLHVTTSEDGAGWLAFFRDLAARGLSGVALVTSDAHRGLTEAIGATLPGAAWQRCRAHYAANLMSVTPKPAWGWVRALLHSVYDQPDAASVHAQFTRVLDALEEKLPQVAAHLDAARSDILAFTAFPKAIWRQIWSNNPQERLNREIRRRTDVVGIFPGRDALIRLVGAVLAEQHDEWTEMRRYIGLDILARSRTNAAATNTAKEAPLTAITA